jgi:hypothetical protein
MMSKFKKIVLCVTKLNCVSDLDCQRCPIDGVDVGVVFHVIL